MIGGRALVGGAVSAVLAIAIVAWAVVGCGASARRGPATDATERHAATGMSAVATTTIAATSAATTAASPPATAASRAQPGPALPAILPMPPGTTAEATRSIEAFVAAAQRTHEAPTPIARQTVLGGWPSPAAAVRGFAATYINWSWTDLALKLRLLAATSVGQARSAMALAAAGAARDYELQHGEISNSGTVEAVAPIAGSHDQYVVVTRERTTAADNSAYSGLKPAWHVALATVTPVQDGLWVLRSWQPEN